MTKNFYVRWLLAFIALVAIDVLWHRVVFGSWYRANDSVARVSNGFLAPIIVFILIAGVLFSGALLYFAGAVSEKNRNYVLNGALLGLVVVGYFSLCGYALIPNWNPAVGVADVLAGVLEGAAVGWLLKYWSRGITV